LPQALKNVLPALVNEMITLLKETSISGYIGLNELTRGSQIITGVTYDAMLPLLAVAAIYLAIVMFFTWIMGKLERRLRESDYR
jgi:ABC-type amino acid transport system permease subunit